MFIIMCIFAFIYSFIFLIYLYCKNPWIHIQIWFDMAVRVGMCHAKRPKGHRLPTAVRWHFRSLLFGRQGQPCTFSQEDTQSVRLAGAWALAAWGKWQEVERHAITCQVSIATSKSFESFEQFLNGIRSGFQWFPAWRSLYQLHTIGTLHKTVHSISLRLVQTHRCKIFHRAHGGTSFLRHAAEDGACGLKRTHQEKVGQKRRITCKVVIVSNKYSIYHCLEKQSIQKKSASISRPSYSHDLDCQKFASAKTQGDADWVLPRLTQFGGPTLRYTATAPSATVVHDLSPQASQHLHRHPSPPAS